MIVIPVSFYPRVLVQAQPTLIDGQERTADLADNGLEGNMEPNQYRPMITAKGFQLPSLVQTRSFPSRRLTIIENDSLEVETHRRTIESASL